MGSRPRRSLNAAQQMLALRATVPGVAGTVRCGALNCTFKIQPSPVSKVYTVRVRQHDGGRPHVTVVSPPLLLHPGATALPHVYPGEELCLYFPGQWKPNMLMTTTIMPWTAEWLMHYELWLVTGQWAGGGYHQ
jgi:hypothetical protein